MDCTITVTLDLPYEQAVPKVKEAFKAQGFGTLTEFDTRTVADAAGRRIRAALAALSS